MMDRKKLCPTKIDVRRLNVQRQLSIVDISNQNVGNVNRGSFFEVFALDIFSYNRHSRYIHCLCVLKK